MNKFTWFASLCQQGWRDRFKKDYIKLSFIYLLYTLRHKIHKTGSMEYNLEASPDLVLAYYAKRQEHEGIEKLSGLLETIEGLVGNDNHYYSVIPYHDIVSELYEIRMDLLRLWAMLTWYKENSPNLYLAIKKITRKAVMRYEVRFQELSDLNSQYDQIKERT